MINMRNLLKMGKWTTGEWSAGSTYECNHCTSFWTCSLPFFHHMLKSIFPAIFYFGRQRFYLVSNFCHHIIWDHTSFLNLSRRKLVTCLHWQTFLPSLPCMLVHKFELTGPWVPGLVVKHPAEGADIQSRPVGCKPMIISWAGWPRIGVAKLRPTLKPTQVGISKAKNCI